MSPIRPAWACALLISLLSSPAFAADTPRADVNGDPLPDGAFARLGTLRWRTSSNVVLASYLGDGKTLLTVSQDQLAQVWDVATDKELRRFDVSGAPNAPLAGANPPVFATRISSGSVLSADGTTLAVLARDGKAHVFDTATGKEKSRVPGGTSRTALALSADGKTLAIFDVNRTTTLWETAGGTKSGEIGRGREGDVISLMITKLAFAADGKTLLQAGYDFVNGGGVKLFVAVRDVATGKELRRLTDVPANSTTALIISAFSPDGRLFAVADQAGKVYLIDVTEGKAVRAFDVTEGAAFANVVFAADGKTLFSFRLRPPAAPVLTGWDVATGKITYRSGKAEEPPAGGARPLPAPAPGVVRAAALTPARLVTGTLAVAPDGKSFAWVEHSAIRLLDLATGRERPGPAGHAAAVQEITFSRDGKTVTTHGGDGAVLHWEVSSGRPVDGPPLPRWLGAFKLLSPDGRTFAGCDANGAVHLVNTASGEQLHPETPADPAMSRAAAFSPDGRTLAVLSMALSSAEQTVRLYDVATGKTRVAFKLPQQAAPGVAGLTLARRARTRNLLFSPDGRLLLVDGQPVTLWETATGREYRQLPLGDGAALRYAAFSPDGRAVALDTIGGGLAVWELATGKRRLPLAEERALTPAEAALASRLLVIVDPHDPSSVAYAPDGRLLAQAGDDGKAHLWDLRTGKEAAALASHRGALTAIAFAPGGNTLATGGADTTALLWDVAGLRAKLTAPSAALTGEKREASWATLADTDTARAYDAVRALAADPAATVALLRERIKPAKAPEAARVKKLIDDLDNDDFAVREQARRDLEKLGEAAAPALRAALKGGASAEQRRQAEAILAGVSKQNVSGESLRLLRGLEALELAGTKDAIRLFEELAGGAAGALATTEARAALDRLGRK